jgi:hypothetical protein
VFAAEGAGALLTYEFILYIVHLGFIVSFGKLLKIPMPDILMARYINLHICIYIHIHKYVYVYIDISDILKISMPNKLIAK